MSIHEIYETLTEMVRQGPGHVVSYLLGLATVVRAPDLRIIDLQPAGTNSWRIRWSSTPGADYQLQRAIDLLRGLAYFAPASPQVPCLTQLLSLPVPLSMSSSAPCAPSSSTRLPSSTA